MLIRCLVIRCLEFVRSNYECSGLNVPQLTSSLQVRCSSPVLHPELGRVGGVLKGGAHVGTQFPVARGQKERGRYERCAGVRKHAD